MSDTNLTFITYSTHQNYHLIARTPSSLPPQMLALCKDLKTLKQAHAHLIILNGNRLQLAAATKLTSLYIDFNDFDSSVSLLKFSKIAHTSLWNKIIKEHVKFGLTESAFSVYKQMRLMGVSHDTYTFPIMNQAVPLSTYGFWYAKLIHCLAMQMGFASDVYFCNTMIDVYVKSGSFRDALMLFNEMPEKDLVSWTTMLGGYLWEGDFDGGFRLYGEMRKELEPNAVTMIVILQLCPSLVELRQFHCCLMKNGIFMDLYVRNAILQRYANLGSFDDSEIVFNDTDERDVVSWNIMMSLYSSKHEILRMVDCFVEMLGEMQPTRETLTLIISGLAEVGNLCQGRQVHSLAIKSGLCDDILYTSLLNFYAKCGKLEVLAQLFREAPCRNTITWSSIISVFVENGEFKEAIELFQYMLVSGVRPVADNLRSLLVAYSHLGALKLGKSIHGYVIRGFLFEEGIVPLETSILNMYIRSGSISTARTCFDRMAARDLVTWTSMIEGYGTHGMGSEALQLFDQMVEEGMEPNSVTFLTVLSACSHCGLLNEGCEVFYSMKWEYGVEPDLNHYTCIVDLLGRLGKIKEALAVILKLVSCPDSRIWGALLAACRVYEDHKSGEYAAARLLELECDNAGYFTLLSNVQATAQRWAEVEQVRSAMKGKDLVKQPGWSCMEIEGLLHGFVSGDRSHPQTNDVYETLGCLSRIMQDVG